ncbi:MAG: hypothetical protein ACOYBY_03490 [Dermatophilaceae bacterium]
MYAALWRALPGGRAAKAFECLVLFVVVVAVLFVWVFPAIAPRLPFENVTLEPGAGASTTPAVATHSAAPAGSARP